MSEMNSIIRRIRNGNQEAFHVLFDCYRGEVLRYLQIKLGNVQAAEDILQDVFCKVWQRRMTLRQNTSIRSFLLTIASHAALNYIRRRKTELKFQLEHQNRGTATRTPYCDLEHKEIHKQLIQSIAELPERPRVVFLMSRFQHLTYSEVARQLDISVKTVESHLGKARHLLRKSLQ